MYEVREGGADEQSIHLLDVKTRQELPDVFPSARYGGVSSVRMRRGFTTRSSSRRAHWCSTTSWARLFHPTAMIFGKSFDGETLGAMDLIYPEVTENGRYLLIHVSHGVPAKASGHLREGLAHPRTRRSCRSFTGSTAVSSGELRRLPLCADGLPGGELPHRQDQAQTTRARTLEDDRSRRQGCDRGNVDRRRQAVCDGTA